MLENEVIENDLSCGPSASAPDIVSSIELGKRSLIDGDDGDMSGVEAANVAQLAMTKEDDGYKTEQNKAQASSPPMVNREKLHQGRTKEARKLLRQHKAALEEAHKTQQIILAEQEALRKQMEDQYLTAKSSYESGIATMHTNIMKKFEDRLAKERQEEAQKQEQLKAEMEREVGVGAP
ncbi:hypothetical protein H0H81_005108 [Sphagnurus paluster]|uniref:Uncharacterized protein n=1 Tax=Sphagnurus paluster TaxID=117069 RepID=A0A9P7FNP4_9AGAR|nr:hypothetical protein H0H81_005108 [Sphagnurus paluster]